MTTWLIPGDEGDARMRQCELYRVTSPAGTFFHVVGEMRNGEGRVSSPILDLKLVDGVYHARTKSRVYIFRAESCCFGDERFTVNATAEYVFEEWLSLLIDPKHERTDPAFVMRSLCTTS